MRITEIKPGMIVAITRSDYGVYLKDVVDGRKAIPAIVIATGRFRWRNEGACVRVVSDDYHTTTVHLKVLDVGKCLGDHKHLGELLPRSRYWDTQSPSDFPGYPDGMKLTSKKAKWVEAIIRPNQVISPWSHYLKVRDERLMVEMEVKGYQQRQAAILAEIREISAAFMRRPGLLGRLGTFGEPKVHIGDHVSISVEYTTIPANFPTSDRKRIEDLAKEYVAIKEKLSCAR